jgi:predicted dehydrogenase
VAPLHRRRSTRHPLNVGVGVVGVGALALRGILPHLAQEDVRDRARVRALCDPVQERAAATAARYDVEKTYATIDELVADDEVDAVTIASPIGLHYEH